jgi:hypothetical protein
VINACLMRSESFTRRSGRRGISWDRQSSRLTFQSIEVNSRYGKYCDRYGRVSCSGSPREGMLMSLTFILGYCGSGKSGVVDELRKKGVVVYDDSFLRDAAKHKELITNLTQGKDCAVAEVAYCRELDRQQLIDEVQAEVPVLLVEYIAFEKEIAKANRNCMTRPKGNWQNHVNINQSIGDDYKIPAGITPRAILVQ